MGDSTLLVPGANMDDTRYAETLSGVTGVAPTARLLMDHFVGRTDTFAVQKEDGTYFRVDRQLTKKDLRKHLKGRKTIGTYTNRLDGTTRCITWDIDIPEYRMVKLLEPNIVGTYWVFTSGRKGYHVIQSFEEPIPTDLARLYGTKVAADSGLYGIEVYPKQFYINTDEGKLGSLTKLPWAKHQVSGNFMSCLKAGGYSPPLPHQLVNKLVDPLG